MLVCLGFSHVDHWLAVRWLRWASRLCMEDGGDSSVMDLVLFGSRRVTAEQWAELHRLHYQSDCMFRLHPAACPDAKEVGYPASATHLFFRALEFCERTFPAEPILWAEADSVPMKPGWAQQIASEYAAAGKPFLGAQSTSGRRHMPGVAVYPANWRAVSPCLAGALSLTDIQQWGPGRSQPWDTACAGDIVPQMAVAETIFQIWKPKRTAGLVERIPKEVCLFHQDKSAVMMETLAAMRGMVVE